ncbi:MAG: hypothetical protein AAFP08_08700 [Bacteroidota bacterium]
MQITSLHWALFLLVMAVATAGGIIVAEKLLTKAEEAQAASAA